jgi:ribonuclease Z
MRELWWDLSLPRAHNRHSEVDLTSSPPSLFLFSSFIPRFLFDAGEGVQRLCIEHRVRLSKMEGVFLTWLSQETVAGLPGEIFLLSRMSFLAAA